MRSGQGLHTRVRRDTEGTTTFIGEQVIRKERYKQGKALRANVPLAEHAKWEVSTERHEVLGILAKSNLSRLANLVPIRYERMLKTPFTFLRGSAAVMAYDLSQTPNSGITVQCCGDCHLANFGLFATPERNLIFDLNDFDETHPAPFEWDVKRLAASFYVAARGNGCTQKKCESVVRTMVRAYRETMIEFSSMPLLTVWYTELKIDDLIAAAPDRATRHEDEIIALKARKRIAEHLFPKITKVVDGRRRIIDQPPLIYHPSSELRAEEAFIEGFEQYRESLTYDRQCLLARYQVDDFVVKVVGVGSVGTRCGVILLSSEGEPLLLQIKEAQPSVLEPYTAPSEFINQGERVVQGQRLLQAASDIFLGWTTTPKGDLNYYVRQLRDMKHAFTIEGFTPAAFATYATICGKTLARAHAKAGDAALISGYLGKTDQFDTAITAFAAAYSQQTDLDHQTLVVAEQTGAITASPDP